MKFYKDEEYPSNIIYLEDNFQHRQIMESEFGKPPFYHTESTYIEFNTETKTWMTKPSFAWLYRDEPPLTNISEVMENYNK